MTRTELDQGAWVELRDPKNVPERLRRPFVNAYVSMLSDDGIAESLKDVDLDALKETPESVLGMDLQMEALLDKTSRMNDVLVLALVSAWSWGPAVDEAALLDLPGWAYDKLRDICGPMANELVPDFGPSPDPKALTAS